MGLFARELETAAQLAREAGRLVLEVYGGAFDVDQKPDDHGPVTEADRRANKLLVDGLRRAFSTDGIVAEESPDRPQHREHERCWFVDPLDGTREFVDHTGMFAVQIGLALHGMPRLGVVYGPVDDRLFVGVPGETAYVEERGTRRALALGPHPVRTDELRLVVSRSHPSPLTDRFRQEFGIDQVQAMGSVGLKCGAIAQGRADLYVHFSGKTYLWDTCAPEAVLRAAGGVLTDLAGVSYRYDGCTIENRRGLIGCHREVLARVLPVAQQIAREAGLT
ncbi:MAG: 3'(2'),5'-bisphosphate nucleotidase CysQ [Myxococcaceae bacterium]|nr:MAG: 3'(2'),5'-bisphosphate nucleotidase CysQ [Myxococcaceae bacterium]